MDKQPIKVTINLDAMRDQLNDYLCSLGMGGLQSITMEAADPDIPLEELLGHVAADDLPRVIAVQTDTVDLPLDKINAVVWHPLEWLTKEQRKQQYHYTIESSEADNTTTATFAIDTSKSNESRMINVQVAIDYGKYGPDGLTAFDARVCAAVAALYNAGNKIISISAVYNAIGKQGRPSSGDINRIIESLDKMRSVQIAIDNADEIAAKRPYPRICQHDSLINTRVQPAIINGQLCDAVYVPWEPILISFARGRKQITTVPADALNTPGRLTDRKAAIENLLLSRIARARHNRKRELTIRLDWIYDALDLRKDKTRIIPTITDALDTYKAQGLIRSYKMDAKSITINFPSKSANKPAQ